MPPPLRFDADSAMMRQDAADAATFIYKSATSAPRYATVYETLPALCCHAMAMALITPLIFCRRAFDERCYYFMPMLQDADEAP